MGKPTARYAETSSPTSSARIEIVKLLALLAEALGIKPAEERIKIYAGKLEHLSHGDLRHGIDQLMVSYKPRFYGDFPTIAEIEAAAGVMPSEIPRADLEAAEAELAWQATEKHIARYFHPDLGYMSQWDSVTKTLVEPPALDPRSTYALRVVGGPGRVLQVIDWGEGAAETYPFVKRDFLAAWKHFPVTEQVRASLEERAPKQLRQALDELADKMKF